MRYFIAFALMAFSVVPSWSGYYTNIDKSDVADGYVYFSMSGNSLYAMNGKGEPKKFSGSSADVHDYCDIDFVGSLTKKTGSKDSYDICFYSHCSDWMRYSEKVSFVIDGVRSVRSDVEIGSRSVSEYSKSGVDMYCSEAVYIKTNRAFLERLANAKSVVIKLYVGNSGITKCFGPDNFKNLKKFLSDTK